jgi:predicted transcriptional regulator YdeE
MSNSSANVNVVELPQMLVAGFGANFIPAMSKGSNATVVIPKLWDQLSFKLDEIRKTLPTEIRSAALMSWMVGAMGEPELPAYEDALDESLEGQLNYFAGVRVDREAPETIELLREAGLQVRHYGGGRYAACEHVGLLDTLPETTAWFYQTWLPAEGPKERYDFHFEIYDERFVFGSPSSVTLICAPIQ